MESIEARLAERLRALRLDRSLTLEGLAERAGVSRSMISVIERGASSPTAQVLDKLSVALGVTLASLFAAPARDEADPLRRRADQVSWRDPATGYVRRNLSPPGFPSPLELVEVSLPPGARVVYDTGPRTPAVHQQVWILDGAVDLSVGETTHALAAGDCLAMRVDQPVAFHNRTEAGARYLVALTTGEPAR